MKTQWKDQPLLYKIVSITSILVSISVIVFAMLGIFDVLPDAGDIYIPLLGVASLCQTYLQWNRARTAAYFNLGAAIIIFICAACVFFIK